MTVLRMERKAADNVYLHRDFHNILNLGLDYLHDHYGPAALNDYLRRFAAHFYGPLIAEVRADGFTALKNRFNKIYSDENALSVLSFEEYRADELIVRIESCPAIAHMLASGVRPSPCFSMTSTVLWQAICEAAGMGYCPLYYEEATGRAAHAFYRRETDGEKRS